MCWLALSFDMARTCGAGGSAGMGLRAAAGIGEARPGMNTTSFPLPTISSENRSRTTIFESANRRLGSAGWAWATPPRLAAARTASAVRRTSEIMDEVPLGLRIDERRHGVEVA